MILYGKVKREKTSEYGGDVLAIYIYRFCLSCFQVK